MNKDNSFPQYRKLPNNKSFYKIIDDRNFQEIQLIGERKAFYTIEAKQYPEILKIQDLLAMNEGQYEISTKEKWDELSED